jgi:hypothetical protein
MASKNILSAGISGNSDWMAEDDMRTLARAEEVKKDAKRFKAAKAVAMKRIAEMEDVFGEEDDKKK